jgi:hypothetical protein
LAPRAARVSALLGLRDSSRRAEDSSAPRAVPRRPARDRVWFSGSCGFDPFVAERYATYRHEPGPLFRLFSRPALSAQELAALRLADRLLGRVGSSPSVRAVGPTERTLFGLDTCPNRRLIMPEPATDRP